MRSKACRRSSAYGVKTIVFNIRSDHAGKMIKSHKGTENFDVSPMDPPRVVRFIECLAKELEQVL